MSGYREAGIEERPHELEVAALQPRTRERIATAIQGSTCLLSLRAPLILPRGVLAAIGALGLLLSLAALVPQFGSLDPPRLPANGRRVLLGSGLVALAAAALLSVHRARVRRGMPFDPGLYLLPLDLLDARSPRLVVRPLSALREVTDNRDIHGQGQATVLRLAFDDGAEFTFPAGQTDATRLAADLSALRTSAELAAAQKQTERLASLDPLVDERPGWPARPAPIGADRSRTPTWPLPLVPLVFPPFFALLTPFLLDARDLASERHCLAQASSAHDNEMLLRIVAQGGPLAEQADAVRFDLARSKGTNEALLRYLRDGLHPAKADDLIFDASMKAGTVEALEQYLIHGRTHRAEVFENLLARGEKSHDVSALRAYERQHGPRQEDVVQWLLPRAMLLGTRAEDLSPSLLRQQAAFSRNGALRGIAQQRLKERYDARSAALGPIAPGAPLDARKLLQLALAHDGVLLVTLENAAKVRDQSPWSGRKAPPPASIAPLHSPYPLMLADDRDKEFVAIFAHLLQTELDTLIERDLIKLEVKLADARGNEPDPPVLVQFEILPIEMPPIASTEATFPVHFRFSLTGDLDHSDGILASTALRVTMPEADRRQLMGVCDDGDTARGQCHYWSMWRHWTLDTIEPFAYLRLLGLASSASPPVPPPPPIEPHIPHRAVEPHPHRR